MTREGIFKLAREAGATPYTNRHYPDRTVHTFGPEQLERFVSLVADFEAKRIHDQGMVTVGHMREQIAKEREACAKVCESEWSNVAERMYGEECAAAIRARGQS